MTLAVGGQAKVLGKAAIGRQMLSNDPRVRPRFRFRFALSLTVVRLI